VAGEEQALVQHGGEQGLLLGSTRWQFNNALVLRSQVALSLDIGRDIHVRCWPAMVWALEVIRHCLLRVMPGRAVWFNKAMPAA
jgi:hypothetical protein